MIGWSSNLRLIESKFDKRGGSNLCNSEWNSALKFCIVRTDYELNEHMHEQIALGLFGFLENSLLLFFFVKVMLTLNDQWVSLEQDDCKFSWMQD